MGASPSAPPESQKNSAAEWYAPMAFVLSTAQCIDTHRRRPGRPWLPRTRAFGK